MKIRFFTFLIMIAMVTCLQAQDKSLYKKEIFVVNNDTLPYRILLPLNYDASKKYPLILMLHGAGERGNDNESQLVHGAGLFLRDSIRQKYPAIVLFPQCPANSYWSNMDPTLDESGKKEFLFKAGGKPTTAMDLVQQLLKNIIKDLPVNKKQIYVGGLSMGGMGTFEIVRRNPHLFAAAFPICGGADPATAKKLTKVKWWIFHGAADEVVSPVYSQKMVDALMAVNADVKFSLYPGVNHNSWDYAYAEPTLMAWLFAQHK